VGLCTGLIGSVVGVLLDRSIVKVKVLMLPSISPPALAKLWADTVRVCCPSVIFGQG
jgi:hypothetical protein